MELAKAENILRVQIGECERRIEGPERQAEIQSASRDPKSVRTQAVRAWPPAFSSLALAEPVNFWAVTLSARLISPSPSTFSSLTPGRMRPAVASTSAFT